MKTFIARNLAFGSLLALFCIEANAGGGGGTIVYAPLSAPVPTLSGSLLIVLGLLLAVVVFRVLRARQNGSGLAALAAIGLAGLSTLTGVKMIEDAQAAVSVIPLPVPQGDTIMVGQGPNQYDNTSGVEQQIISVTPAVGCSVGIPAGTPECTAGLGVPNGASCFATFTCEAL